MTTKLGDWIQQQLPEDRLHLLRHQPSYFAKGGQVQRLVAWLTDFGFLQQKLEAVGINPLIDDYDLAIPLVSETEQQTLKLIQGALRLSAHILDQNKTKLAEQMLGRLLSFEIPEIQTMLETAKQWQGNTWLRPLTANLTPPGGSLIRTLTGHSDRVTAVAITPDGKQAVSASGDNTLKLWNLATGSEVATLSGHSNAVLAVAITPDGFQAVSASGDNTLKLWNLATGLEAATLSGYSKSVTAVAITADGKFALSGSEDRTLKLWDLGTGDEVATFSGEYGGFNCCAVAADGVTVVVGNESGRVHFLRLEGV
ncbi:WD40 repeat domain-containing protein [[Phormidium] sp. ETS-05]|uniref:WD40 repeat domain-containing protein n=1 Tax=[Phormidium] sp. ETS-05 TaxID=222819 RepID=UPI0018EECF54|nr:WD40 repeat domain-containing protein [[Phormidium] sp. ETS-05]